MLAHAHPTMATRPSLSMHRWPLHLAAAMLFISCLLFSPISDAAWAYDNPDLLPDHPTPVIDLAKALTDQQRTALETELEDFERSSGWKLRVLTQYERTPGLAVRNFWNLDQRSLVLVADPRGGNLLNFNVGDALFSLMPRTFWVELQTRYGNQYYVRDHGEDGSILASLHAVEGCLIAGGCQVVPGLPMELLSAGRIGGGICIISKGSWPQGRMDLGVVAITPMADSVRRFRGGTDCDPHQRLTAVSPQWTRFPCCCRGCLFDRPADCG
jgi:hypothetical protein